MASSVSLHINQSVSLTTMILDAYGAAASTAKTIVYVSSDPEVATLANNGTFVQGTTQQNSVSTNTIYGISNGSAVITITVDGSIVDTITVTVNSPPVAGMNFVFGTPIP